MLKQILLNIFCENINIIKSVKKLNKPAPIPKPRKETPTLIKRKIIIISPKDNVATALVDLKAGEVLSKEMDGTQKDIKLNQDIPFGHKLGILEIPAGSPVIKYGETIGTASMAIKTGDYVHIHNVKSNRGRGDIKGGTL